MLILMLVSLAPLPGAAQGMTAVFINEIHYDNAGTDAGEAIEIAGPTGTDLVGWSIALYNGANGALYNTLNLTGFIPDQQDGFGTRFFAYPENGIQNGSPDGIALVNPSSAVVQFLSYEGTFAAVGGPAGGLTSTDIGVQEPSDSPVGFSLQLTGAGTVYEDFVWGTASPNTFGAINTGQSFGTGEPPPVATVIINEVDSDTPGTDALELVELYDGGTGNTVLDGLVVVFYNGSNDLSYAAFDLDGFSTDADGYFVLGNAAVSPAPGLIFAGNFLQNGADAVAVYAGNSADFPNNTPITATNLQDAVVYDTDDADDPGLLALLNAGQPQVNENGGGDGANHSSQRCPNGSGGARNTTSYRQGSPSPSTTSNCAPPPTAVTIMQIQGAAHKSLLLGQNVVTTGIVTAVSSNGFYLQDPVGDGDIATSDALFVFTSSAPAVVVGDSLSVTGAVAEFYPGGFGSGNLSTTEITGPTITVVPSLGSVPFPTIIGIGGRVPPTNVIDDDATGDVETTGTFDPATDGIDFYESLEGMRVQVNNAVAVGPTNDFGEIAVIGDNGINAGARTTRGGIVVQPGDFNPERVILDDVLQPTPDVNVNDRFASVVGVLDYSFGNFKLLVTETPTAVSGGLTREMAAPAVTGQLSISTFNVENLDPTDDPAKFAALASQIVSNLRAPDIIGLEEVQDNNGAATASDSVVDASQTYQMLIAAIQAAGGPVYEFRDIPPVDDQDGGEPGGNIRVGFLFRPDRVDFVDRPGGGSTTATTVSLGADGVELSASPGRIDPTNAAFNTSRKPLVAEFIFNGETVFAIINHFNSKGGDNPLFGRVQPPVLSSEAQRIQQAQVVNGFVESILALDPDARVVVFGDLNDFPFSEPLSEVAEDDLTNLVPTLPIQEQYTFIFDGNSQVLDNFLVSDALLAETSEFDIVHTNAEFADQDSDHDPGLGRFGIARTVLVDIRPLSDDNIINLRSRLLLPVAIFSTPEFDATTINPQTVTLAGAPVARLFGIPLAVRVDVNRDGLRDWLLSFEPRDLQLTPSSTEAVLEGQTFAGFRVRGSDSVRILPTTAPGGLVANYPTFTWDAVEGAVCYQIQIDNSRLFVHPEQDATVDGTTYNASPLPPGQYYWRVRVGGTCVNVLSGPWSSAQQFTVP
jgi:predicted extracellular nuclease